ncbi:DUF2125 domain-containing protein [Microvirga lotononidis]|uniref:DUF2125 domain-containing protein n=1 Tax=Microvirga lotononidis TaxID=864069 RepID=I4Z033_9HYPH|nr:DUF2125 domain-containing protein [Microvirga lotononidis]EIM29575.1 hypothetical protein MicloDRAFT_00020560 [Microvirga lotononidis]WQO27118.1 DUF2125 domain-containing protein [Microvirga lotononidis]
MDQAAPTASVRRSRFWLYTPFVLLLLIAVAWSIAWFVIRNRTAEALDGWIAAEARNGRQWTCGDRSIAGYPFRIEIICESLDLKRGSVSASFGRTEAVAQIYQPRRVIVEVAGPLRVTDGTVTVDGSWSLLQASINASQTGLQRLSLAADSPKVSVTGLGNGEIAGSGRHLELHLRPNPSRRAELAGDVAASVTEARIPILDALVGGAEPTNLNADLTVTQADGFKGGTIVEELELWRNAGGKLDILMLSATKGARQIETKGELRLDEQHRPAGQLTVSAAGLDGLLGNLTGGRVGGNLLGMLLGQGPRSPQGQPNAKPQLASLPPLRLEKGFLSMGPFVIPNLRLQPLY